MLVMAYAVTSGGQNCAAKAGTSVLEHESSKRGLCLGMVIGL